MAEEPRDRNESAEGTSEDSVGVSQRVLHICTVDHIGPQNAETSTTAV